MQDDIGGGHSGRRMGSSRDRVIRQAHDILRASIRRGLVGPGSPFVEHHLTRSLGIGRNTLREALKSLADEGLLVRRPGIGTIVARKMLRVSTDEILAFDDSVEDPASRVGVTVLAIEPVEIGEVLSATLRLGSGRMTMVEVLVSFDAEPICVLATYLPPDVDETRFTQGYESVYVTFERLLGTPLGRIATTVEAVNADAWASEILGVPAGAALILREQELLSADGDVAVFSFARYRSDRVAFTASVTLRDKCSQALFRDSPSR